MDGLLVIDLAFLLPLSHAEHATLVHFATQMVSNIQIAMPFDFRNDEEWTSRPYMGFVPFGYRVRDWQQWSDLVTFGHKSNAAG